MDRREFMAVTAGLTTMAYAGFNLEAITIAEAIEKIKAEITDQKLERTIDTIKTGNPGITLTGIGVTFFATLPVIRNAIAGKCNLLITHEPTFYNHLDTIDKIQDSPVYKVKRKLIDDNHLVIWRCHDYIHAMKPDGILTGMIQLLQWEKYQTSVIPGLFKFSEKKLDELITELKTKLAIPVLRVVGDVKQKIKTVGLLPGAWGGATQIAFIEKHHPDVLICGEISEWETSEYVRDAIDSGMNKALIVLGHVPSEENGMNYLAQWLKPLFADIPVRFFSTGAALKII